MIRHMRHGSSPRLMAHQPICVSNPREAHATPSAGNGMTSLLNLRHAWPRIGTVGLRIGALALLFYGASFYTRDWRSVVPEVGRPAPAQAATRPVAAPQPLALAQISQPSVSVEPTTTGALPRVAEAAARPSAAEKVSRLSASPGLQAQAVAPGSRVQHKPNKRTQVAARPPVKRASVNDLTPSPPEATVQPRPEEPVQFRLA